LLHDTWRKIHIKFHC
jgi:hypothetical protein